MSSSPVGGCEGADGPVGAGTVGGGVLPVAVGLRVAGRGSPTACAAPLTVPPVAPLLADADADADGEGGGVVCRVHV